MNGKSIDMIIGNMKFNKDLKKAFLNQCRQLAFNTKGTEEQVTAVVFNFAKDVLKDGRVTKEEITAAIAKGLSGRVKFDNDKTGLSR